MKKTILLSLITALSILGYAQTTIEEYNYLSKGYKIQIESGLDMKKGYSFKDAPIMRAGSKLKDRNTTFKFLMREGEKIPAAILMIMERKDTKYKKYFCIPSYVGGKNKGEVWEMFGKAYAETMKSWQEPSIIYSIEQILMISYMSTVDFMNISDYELEIMKKGDG